MPTSQVLLIFRTATVGLPIGDLDVGLGEGRQGLSALGSLADISLSPPDVRVTPKADIRTQSRNVRFVPQADILRRTKIVPFVDHLVGAQPAALAKGH